MSENSDIDRYRVFFLSGGLDDPIHGRITKGSKKGRLTILSRFCGKLDMGVLGHVYFGEAVHVKFMKHNKSVINISRT